MTEGGFYQPKRLSPTGMTVVVLLHGAAITALMMTKMGMPTLIKDPPIIVYPIPVPPPPPPNPVPPPPNTRIEDMRVTTTPPVIDHPIDRAIEFPPFPPSPPPNFSSGAGTGTIVEPPPPPPPPPKFEPARARADLHSYVSNADYPDAAIRGEEQGTTRFRLSVGPDGRVTDCAVTGSSGSSSLDATTCRLMRMRAHFAPARDGSGHPTTDNVASAIRWVLPDG